MPLQLKPYQQDCLDALSTYFTRIVQLDNDKAADTAFYELSNPRRFYHPVPQLQFTPYVCLRVPTGGGKTFLAANALKVAAEKLFRQDFILALWLAPTNTIVDQTLKALRDRSHPYRQSIDQHFGGNVTILSLEEAFSLQRHVLDASTVVIVSTFAGLNVDDKDNRRVYDQNGSLMPAFTGLTEKQIAELQDPNEPNGYTPSLANLIRLRHPFIIMDEAHNARTQTAFNTLKRFRPLAILELTATPSTDKPPSNVLHHVSAAQLKADSMIKLPVKLRCRPQWKEAVQAALAEQKRLEQLAQDNEKTTGRYIRPIILFQAQNEKDGTETITPEVLKTALINEFNIPKEHIAIATGKVDELGKTDVFSNTCPIRYIITVQKLREGWDCSFAYILCSVTNLHAHTAVEQILGRVLRLPYATKQTHEDLNTAYAFATSPDFVATASDLTDALVDSGFSKYEAQISIQPDDGDLFPDQLTEQIETITVPVSSAPNLAQVPAETAQKLSYDGTKKTLAWSASSPMTTSEKKKLESCFSKPEDKQQVERIYRKSRGLDASPSALGEVISIPRLAVREGNQFAIFEDQFLEIPWKLSDSDPTLTDEHFSLNVSPDKTAIVDVTKEGKLTTNFVEDIQQQLSLFHVGPKTITELTVFLAKSIAALDVTHADMIDFLHKAIRRLMDARGFSIEALCNARYKLLDALALRINRLRANADNERFQKFLLPDCETPLDVSPEVVFKFPLNVYPARTFYQGSFHFQKHYYANIGDLNGEEAQCAAHLDNHPKVKYWVRNIERRPEHSFWLQTSTDKFYPDFVAVLTDGRFLVIEYKGENISTTDDTKEKTMIGQLWESRSNNTCLFRLVTKDTMKEILNAI